MADKENKPLSAELVPSPPSHAPAEGDAKPQPCVACRGWHGGVNQEIICLRRTVLRQRSLVIELGDQVSALLKGGAK